MTAVVLALEHVLVPLSPLLAWLALWAILRRLR